MKQRSLLLTLSFVIAACSSISHTTAYDPVVLKGVHRLYVEAPWQQLIADKLGSELPQVQLVSRQSDADAVIAMAVETSPASTVDTQDYQTVTWEGGSEGNGGLQTHTVTIPIGSPVSRGPATIRIIAINRTTGRPFVVYEGFREFANERLATQFISAWRNANRS